MEKYFIICLLVFQIHNSAYSQNFTEEDRDRLAGYIFRQQYTNRELTSYGAIKTSDYPVIEDSLSGNAYFSVYPYFSHIACLGILNSKHSEKFNFVKLWIDWFIKHLDSRGNILNHYYTLSGEGTTCINKNLKYFCNDIDAEDSALALFWVVTYEYYKHSKDLTLFTVDVKKKLELSAHYVINNLLKENNLTIAKKDYSAYYTMDNCEVYKGFLYLSKIENEIYNDQVLAEYYQNKAENCKVAIQNLLYDYTTDLYKWELNINSNPDIWYGNKGGIVPTLWPQLFEVDQFSDLRSEYSRKMVEHKFPDWHSEKKINILMLL
ncbi:hypothetical protein [Apibacter sp. HY039]|uniref:hypothetical protein n=1 Tax=Apibacter sp. HY039 TaxID=2501476 RepID=UPI000FEC1DDB|nr:hypothetical protein [Apibacter sp. HY039]